jgi:hypothetical protein
MSNTPPARVNIWSLLIQCCPLAGAKLRRGNACANAIGTFEGNFSEVTRSYAGKVVATSGDFRCWHKCQVPRWPLRGTPIYMFAQCVSIL